MFSWNREFNPPAAQFSNPYLSSWHAADHGGMTSHWIFIKEMCWNFQIFENFEFSFNSRNFRCFLNWFSSFVVFSLLYPFVSPILARLVFHTIMNAWAVWCCCQFFSCCLPSSNAGVGDLIVANKARRLLRCNSRAVLPRWSLRRRHVCDVPAPSPSFVFPWPTGHFLEVWSN